MRTPFSLLTMAAVLLFPLAAGARLIRQWTDAELLAESDVIVVAVPVSVKDTGGTLTLPEVPAAAVTGVATRFAVTCVVKGDRSLKEVTLHHARIADGAGSPPNGPLLAQFDPAKKQSWLLYMALSEGGKLEPVTGQADPAHQAVVPVNPPPPLDDAGPGTPVPPPDGIRIDPDRAAGVPVILRVQYLSASGSDKYGWSRVRVLRVLKNDTRHVFFDEFEIAHLSTEPGVPEGVCTVYLERYRADSDDLWKLRGGSAKQGVSHLSRP